MLFRLVRPVKRTGSRNPYFVRRIPIDVRALAVGLRLAIPLGEATQKIIISARSQSIRLSLRTDDPSEVKLRQAAVDAYLENVWKSLRSDAPVALTGEQSAALAGEFYRSWANESRMRSTAIERIGPDDPSPDRIPGTQFKRLRDETRAERIAIWEAVVEKVEAAIAADEPSKLEEPLGAIADRLLMKHGIGKIDAPSRLRLLEDLALALRDAFRVLRRNAEGDYSPDPTAARFPQFVPSTVNGRPTIALPSRTQNGVSLKGLVESWWTEASATGRKPSTHESYTNTMAAFVAFLGHDDAGRVTRDDVVGFKDHRLASVNPRNGKPVSPKTVKDSDLAGLKTVFGWAVANGKIGFNPAEGVTIKLGKSPKLRSKAFTDAEAEAILKATQSLQQGRERPKTFAAKRWVPWLCAYTGARVGELIQLRKEDIRHEGPHWVAKITPDAGTVKTNEARDVVLHPHVEELGFIAFMKAAPSGHLFLTLSPEGDVLGPLQGIKNRLAEFVRTVVADKNVAPNHGWRHRFKSVGIEAGIEHRILDAIQGHTSRNVAEGYGEVSIKAQAAAIAKLPRYNVTA